MNARTLSSILKKGTAAALALCLNLIPGHAAFARVIKVRLNGAAGMNAPAVQLRMGTAAGIAATAALADVKLGAGVLPTVSSIASPRAAAPGAISVHAAGQVKAIAPATVQKTVKTRAVVSAEMTGMKKQIAALPQAEKTSTGKAYGAGLALEAILTGRRSHSFGGLVRGRDASFTEGFAPTVHLEIAAARAAKSAMVPLPAKSAAARAKSFLTSRRGILAVVAGAAVATTAGMIVLQLYMPAIIGSLGLIGMTGTLWGKKDKDKEQSAPLPEGEPAPAYAHEADGASYNTAPDAALQEAIAGMSGTISALKAEIRRVIVGQEDMVESIIVAMIAGEHILLEGVPGVAKTRTVQAFADATGADFQRIQGTPDKMPADILGAEVLQTQADGTRKLVHEKGPIFARVVLFDEINRAMPKTQSAMLEAMQERKVTIGRETFDLPKPFLLLATQNPIEQEGTYPLPEAQQDRFMYKIVVPQPTREERKKINELNRKKEKVKTEQAVEVDELVRATEIAEQVRLDPALQDYIQDIIDAALAPHEIGIGTEGIVEQAMITRASIFMEKAARIHALMQGRSYVTPQDIRDIAPKILRHRIILSYAAGERTTDDLIREILHRLPVPGPQG
ncbi:MAG: MoxR family ATPase [Elusimicrobiota bacterium]